VPNLPWKEWVLDVTQSQDLYAFCPLENGNVVLGMTVLSERCPGRLVAAYHEAGQDAVEAWFDRNQAIFESLQRKSNV
jgi:hypothetical protein